MMSHISDETQKARVLASLSDGLEARKMQLALLQAACTLALEGEGRATAGEISARACRDYHINITPSQAGQVFISLEVPTATTHGKRKYLLNYEKLDEWRQEVADRAESLAQRMEAALEAFRELPDRIDELQAQWQEIRRLHFQGQELQKLIRQGQPIVNQLSYLQLQAERTREQVAEVHQLEEECRGLEAELEKLPELEARRVSLEEKRKEYQAQLSEVSDDERQLSQMITRIKQRAGWVTLAQLNQSIAQTKEELENLSRQLGEKRSLLDRMLRRKQEGQSK